jgi:TRAP-type C4-dicarboxylate transport system permease small subunit
VRLTRATLSHFMPDPNQKRTNSALWLGLLITVLGPLSNYLYYSKFPAAVLPWLNLAIPTIGLLLVLIGVARAFRQPQLYRGKILGSIFTVLAALFFGGSLWLFMHVRDLPRSAGAPQVGQRVPDFTLPDSTNQPVSLAQLFSAAPGTAQPKALLLVFYRGYW